VSQRGLGQRRWSGCCRPIDRVKNRIGVLRGGEAGDQLLRGDARLCRDGGREGEPARDYEYANEATEADHPLIGGKSITPGIDRDFVPFPTSSHLLPQFRGRRCIHRERFALKDDAVILARRALADEIVEHVA